MTLQPLPDRGSWQSPLQSLLLGLSVIGCCTVTASLPIAAVALPAIALSSEQAVSVLEVGQIVGRWQAQIAGQTVNLVILNDGRLFVLDPQGGSACNSTTPDKPTAQPDLNPCKALEVGKIMQKTSPVGTLPPNVEVINLAEVYAEQANRARQSEAKQYVSAMNRAQQAYFLEKERFATQISDLGLGIKSETENYRYRLMPLDAPPSKTFPSPKNRATVAVGIAKTENLKSYIGVVWEGLAPDNEAVTFTLVCESNQPTKTLPGNPTFEGDGIKPDSVRCPIGFSPLP